MKNYSRKTG